MADSVCGVLPAGERIRNKKNQLPLSPKFLFALPASLKLFYGFITQPDLA